MFNLVNDVDAYPEFLNWCTGARVERVEAAAVEAAVDVGLAGFTKTFKTRNVLTAPSETEPGRIGVDLLEGPFRRLAGSWTFTNLPTGSRVDLFLDYEMKPSPLSMIFSAAFDEIARAQVSAFISRAEAIYGQE